MSNTSAELADILKKAIDEYPVNQIGEGLSHNPARDAIEGELPKRIKSLVSSDEIEVQSSTGKGRWTSIPWVAVMDPRQTDRIQEGVYVVYLFEPQENRVSLTLNQGVTKLKNERGTGPAREQLLQTARGIKSNLYLDDFLSGPLKFPHASSRNKLYGPGTIVYKRYTLDNMPSTEEADRDLKRLVEEYRRLADETEPAIYQCPIKPDGVMERNYQRTVVEGVERDLVADICDISIDHENLRVWGNQADIPAKPGDYLLFADRDGRYDGEYTLLTRIADATILNEEAATEFTDAVGWGKGIDDSFQHVMFLEPLHEADLSREDLWDLLGFNGWPNDTYSQINFERHKSSFYDEYDSVTSFIDELSGRQIYPNPSTSELVPDGPRSELDTLLEAEGPQADLFRRAAAHLVAGKNVVFYGPPGTGKTRAANLLTDALCASDSLVTANSEWSNYQVVGGYRPAGDSWEPEAGFLTAAAEHGTETLRRQPARPTWLIIDELNRANLDEAFGDVFTLLDLDYRTTEPLSYADKEVYVPLSFRILATMNTYDQAQLFSLGYAFRRRFAFVRVRSLLEGSDRSVNIESSIPSTQPELDTSATELVDLIKQAVIESMCRGTEDEGVTERDVAVIFPEFADRERIKTAYRTIETEPDLQIAGLTPTEMLVYFCMEVTDGDIVDIGQALLIDAMKYLVAHQLLFPKETSRSALDEAVVSYIVPQFEHFMSELRRAETIDKNNNAEQRFDRVVQLARDLSLPRAAAVLEEAKETKRLLS